ncbi:MAG: YicC/YloC family endoribonuclease [Gammaproteobacteria bacterium]
MPHSMTGFASAEARRGVWRLSWEIRSVNHRFLDLSFRMPEDLRALEPECRDVVGDAVKRGKLDCTLKIMTADRAVAPTALVDDAVQRLRALEASVKAAFPHAAPLSTVDVLRWPGLLEEPVQNLEELATSVKECLAVSVQALQDARGREGARIAELLEKRHKGITALIDGIRPLIDGVQVRYRDRLRERVQRLDVQADPGRLEQELALLAQRADVAEEIDRLGSHVTEISDILRRSEPVGRRLDFVIQELNREANTFASKVQEEPLTRVGVELKVLIEQMREQVQNLE